MRSPGRNTGRPHPVQLFGREQHAMYHTEQEDTLQEQGGEGEYETSEMHWADGQFGVYEEPACQQEHYQEDQYGEY